MKYIQSIVRAFKANKKVLYKLVLTLAIVFSLSYLPHVILVYMIRTLGVGCIVMSMITLIYIGIKDTQFRKKETFKLIGNNHTNKK